MPTSFFDQQQEARTRSRWAVFGFILTVAFTLLGVSLVTALLLGFTAQTETDTAQLALQYQWDIVLTTAGLTLTVVCLASLFRHLQMRAGPEHVMRAMDGRRIDPETPAPPERQLLNIVEEMAIASGLPVPDVYIVDEPGINAFAVGLSTDRAAIGVTRGALDTFTRDELQGVIAHEFSHILNGDMRLNTRLIAWLAGIFVLSELGLLCFRMALYSGNGRRSRSDKDNGGGTLVLLALGLAIWLCGAIGLLMGRILQAALSRQREFLADASAVQFTRNPDGIANALRKLGRNSRKAKLLHAESLEVAHMMFGSAKPLSLTGLMATHPPLDARIRAILPSWDGTFLPATPNQPPPLPKTSAPPPPLPKSAVLLTALATADTLTPSSESPEAPPTPGGIRDAARSPDGARALVYLLLTQDTDPDTARIQTEALTNHETTALLHTLHHLRTLHPAIPEADRIPLLDLAAPALRHLAPPERETFKTLLDTLIRADNQVTLYEFAVRTLALRAIETPEEVRARSRRSIHIRSAEAEVNLLLSFLAHIGADTQDQAQTAFEAARQQLLGYTGGIQLQLLPPETCTLAALHHACTTLATLYPAFQQRLILAAHAILRADGELRPAEHHAFRAAAAALNVPLPPDFNVD